MMRTHHHLCHHHQWLTWQSNLHPSPARVWDVGSIQSRSYCERQDEVFSRPLCNSTRCARQTSRWGCNRQQLHSLEGQNRRIVYKATAPTVQRFATLQRTCYKTPSLPPTTSNPCVKFQPAWRLLEDTIHQRNAPSNQSKFGNSSRNTWWHCENSRYLDGIQLQHAQLLVQLPYSIFTTSHKTAHNSMLVRTEQIRITRQRSNDNNDQVRTTTTALSLKMFVQSTTNKNLKCVDTTCTMANLPNDAGDGAWWITLTSQHTRTHALPQDRRHLLPGTIRKTRTATRKVWPPSCRLNWAPQLAKTNLHSS